LDDAGDAGFKIGKGSSRYFVIACVIFDEPLDAEFATVSIKMLRRELGWRNDHEFKFNKNRVEHKIRFLKHVSNINFKIRAIIVDKTKIDVEELKQSKQVFYLTVIQKVLSHFGDRMNQANIYLDGNDARGYREAIKVFFRHELN
jgi:formyltetrahydrofolate synthetase